MQSSNRRKPGNANRYGAATVPSSPAARAAERRKAAQTRYGLMALGSVIALVFSMAWNPPTGSVHSFTTASDFKAVNDSGCTNSGAGCHGKESEYKNFNAYHPEIECIDCHEYTGVGCIPCHSPREHECALCHDGSMPNAPDRVRLTDPYPRGHYRETSHTVDVASMKTVVKASATGKAEARCTDCHSSDLRKAHTAVPPAEGSTYGPDVGCGECHNDTGTFGQVEVISNWKSRRCESCHKTTSRSPAHSRDSREVVEARDGGSCGDTGQGCHLSSDLHELHADKPATCSGNADDDEPGCHELEIESHTPRARGCGGTGKNDCHRGSGDTEYVHKNMDVHSPDTAADGHDTSFYDVACGACHAMEPDGTSMLVEHGGSAAILSTDPGSCRACHNAAASRAALKAGTFDCDACHGRAGLPAAHSVDLPKVHTLTQGSSGCASTGPGCHGANLFAVGEDRDAIHRDCLRCHDRTASDGNLSYDPTKKTCGSSRDCHAQTGEFDPATSRHTVAGKRVGGTDTAHHTAGSQQASALFTDGATGVSTPCRSCHSAVLGIEHGRVSSTSARGNVCVRCHNANDTATDVVKSSWPARKTTRACVSCHDGQPATPAPHTSIDTVHGGLEVATTGVVAAGACAKAGCHPTADVRILHADKGCAFQDCHSASGDIRGLATMRCGGGAGELTCHARASLHQSSESSHVATELDRNNKPVPGSCVRAGCHATANVRTLHADGGGCETPGCHGASGPTYMTCGGSDSATGSCHTASKRHTNRTAKHQATELDRNGVPTPGSCARAGCHATVDVMELHETTHCETPGCHVAGGPTFMTCGGPDGTAGACHTASKRHANRTAKHQAVTLNSSNTPSPTSCARPGCHATVDVMELHETTHCETPGCHVAGGPTFMTCGGSDTATGSCHTSSQRHTNRAAKHQATELDRFGVPTPGSCARAGCHATVDVMTLHDTTHCSTPGCHVAGGPTFMTCGGPDGTAGACHTSSQRHANRTAKHQAVTLNSSNNPSPTSCARAGCHATVDVMTLHETTHCETPGCHVAGGPTFMRCGGSDTATDTCHVASQRHTNNTAKHTATERTPAGDAVPGTCVSSGCHETTYVRDLHNGCSTAGCHVAGGPVTASCGGSATDPYCHVTYDASQHFQSHEASITGTLNGITYGAGQNSGCLGPCHSADLVVEHSTARTAGVMEGTSATVCRVCHYSDSDAGAGTYSGSAAVKNAIAAQDRRCISCHASGSSADGPTAVGSPPSTCIPSVSGLSSREMVTTATIIRNMKTLADTGSVDASRTAELDRAKSRHARTSPGAAVTSAAASRRPNVGDAPRSLPSTETTAPGSNGDSYQDRYREDTPTNEPAARDGRKRTPPPAQETTLECPAEETEREAAPPLETSDHAHARCLECHEVVHTDKGMPNKEDRSD